MKDFFHSFCVKHGKIISCKRENSFPLDLRTVMKIKIILEKFKLWDKYLCVFTKHVLTAKSKTNRTTENPCLALQ